MFGGATSYVDTLDTIINYVDDQHPTTDAGSLVVWQSAADHGHSRDR
jgi:putative restriction endonuclease